MVAARLIIGLAAVMPDGDGHAGKKGVQLGVALIGIGRGDDRRWRRIFGLDAVDLLGIENRIPLEERHLTLAILASLCALLCLAVGVHLDLVGIDDG